MKPINARADLEALRGSPEFAGALRMLYGSTMQWDLVDGDWVGHEDLSSIVRFGYSKPEFLAEIEPFDFPPLEAPPPPPPPLPPTQEQLDGEAKIVAQQALSHMLAASIITDDERPEEQRRALAPLFPRWRADEVVVPGDLRRHGEELFECIQGHTTQSDWEPNNAPALWKVTLPAGQIGPWKQPAGTHDAYQIGDKVTHNGSTWTSTHADNVWEPGVFGWMEEA